MKSGKKVVVCARTHILYSLTLNELTGVDCRMEADHRSLVEKSLLEEINEIKKCRNKSLIACSVCYFMCYFKNG